MDDEDHRPPGSRTGLHDLSAGSLDYLRILGAVEYAEIVTRKNEIRFCHGTVDARKIGLEVHMDWIRRESSSVQTAMKRDVVARNQIVLRAADQQMESPLRLGVETEKHSQILRIAEKHGRSGDMLFVTVRSEYRQAGELCLSEEQNIVYRSDQGRAEAYTRVETELDPSTAVWRSEPAPTTTTLFRYSALTSNPHRIHYDLPYACEVEGYPGLVVHGPLLATYLAELIRLRSGYPLREFWFRLQHPVFLGDRFRVEANPDNGGVALGVVSGDGIEHVTATGIPT